ncbi:hypothetical protein MSPP1_003884 [Malassezia sp. CBS 17886]|nr:hypothetical protein MSPP1_003884 [Malassezia sp. CBS 17886]
MTAPGVRDPIFASAALATVADWTEALTRTQAHAVYVPVALLTLLHAVRVSHGARVLGGGVQTQVHLFQSLVLDQVVLFGGSVLAALLLGAPLPFVVSPFPVIVYAGVHALLWTTGLGTLLLRAHGASMDIAVAAVDAVCRSEGIVHYGLALVQNHPSALVAHSLFARLLVGAMIGGGVSLLVGVFRLNAPSGMWSFGTPTWVLHPAQLLLPDLWGGCAAALVYTFLTRDGAAVSGGFPAFDAGYIQRVHAFVVALLERLLHMHPSARVLEKPVRSLTRIPFLSAREAKAASAGVLFLCLLVPMVRRHVAAAAAHRGADAALREKRPPPAARGRKAAKESGGAGGAKALLGDSRATDVVSAHSVRPAGADGDPPAQADAPPAVRRRGRPKKNAA